MSANGDFQERLEAKRVAVRQARAAAEKATKKADALEAELRGWEEAASCITGETGAMEASASPKRGLSEGWKSVLAAIAQQYPKEFTLAEIATLCEQHNVTAQPDTIRSQMHIYTMDRKYLTRTSHGRFQATQEGATAAAVTLGIDLDADIPF